MFMSKMFTVNFFILTVLSVHGIVECRYEPTWESLDSRPQPDWYDQAKIGIFLHWGVFSVPSFGSEWFWKYWNSKNTSISTDYVSFMKKNYKPDFGYQDFAPQLTAEFYDPDKWADIFQASGAKYIVFTSKHHEGFTLWPSKVSWNWNSLDVGPKRDLLGDLAKAIRSKTDLHFGVYYSLYEWYHPLYLLDKNNSFETQIFVKSKMKPELIDLVTQYEPHVIWADGDWEASDEYFQSKEFLAWLYNESPVKDIVVVNDRWGIGIPCKHGGYYTCEDRYNPKKLQNHKWENAMTLDKRSWGYRRNADLSDYLTTEDLLAQLAETVSCGGNLLINVGPTHDGRIIPIFEERLRQLGSWLKVNSDAIYGTSPWKAQNDSVTPGVWYTSKGVTVYAIVLNWPKNNVLKLGSLPVADKDILTMLGVPGQLVHRNLGKVVEVTFPTLMPDSVSGMAAWVLQL